MREYGDEALELLKEISKHNSTVDGMFGNILLQDEVAKAYDMAVAIALHNKGRTGNKEGIVNAVEFRSIAGKIMKARLLGYSDKAKANFWIGWELLSAAKDRSRLFILTISHELMHNVLRELGISSDTFSKKVIHELLSDVYSLVMAELIEGKEAVAEFEKIMGYDEAVQAVAVNADHTTEGHEGARAQLR
jgi:hypothetical protein